MTTKEHTHTRTHIDTRYEAWRVCSGVNLQTPEGKVAEVNQFSLAAAVLILGFDYSQQQVTIRRDAIIHMVLLTNDRQSRGVLWAMGVWLRTLHTLGRLSPMWRFDLIAIRSFCLREHANLDLVLSLSRHCIPTHIALGLKLMVSFFVDNEMLFSSR